MTAEVTPSGGYDNWCMAVSVDTSNVWLVYYAVTVATSNSNDDWSFFIYMLDYGSPGSSTVKEILNADIIEVLTDEHERIRGGMHYGTSASQFFFMGVTKDDIKVGDYDKKHGFLFTTDLGANKCTDSTASIGTTLALS